MQPCRGRGRCPGGGDRAPSPSVQRHPSPRGSPPYRRSGPLPPARGYRRTEPPETPAPTLPSLASLQREIEHPQTNPDPCLLRSSRRIGEDPARPPGTTRQSSDTRLPSGTAGRCCCLDRPACGQAPAAPAGGPRNARRIRRRGSPAGPRSRDTEPRRRPRSVTRDLLGDALGDRLDLSLGRPRRTPRPQPQAPDRGRARRPAAGGSSRPACKAGSARLRSGRLPLRGNRS